MLHWGHACKKSEGSGLGERPVKFRPEVCSRIRWIGQDGCLLSTHLLLERFPLASGSVAKLATCYVGRGRKNSLEVLGMISSAGRMIRPPSSVSPKLAVLRKVRLADESKV